MTLTLQFSKITVVKISAVQGNKNMLKWLFGFLFGRSPKIMFTDSGQVSHQHPDKYWEDWKNRFSQDSSYNWKNHSGMT